MSPLLRAVANTCAGLLACAFVAVPVSAEPGVIPVEADADWTHHWTGITISPVHAGFERAGVHQFVDDQFNVSVQLWDESRRTSITIYIYRAGAANVSIWADRAVTAMLANPRLGSPVEGQFLSGHFTPLNGSGTYSGFHAITPLEGGEMTATGVSLFAHDDWLIKVRASSRELGAAQVTEAIGSVISAMKLEQSSTTYPPVSFIEECSNELRFAEKVKVQQLDLMGQLMLAPLAANMSVAGTGKAGEEAQWCRDPQSSLEVGIYRDGGSKDSYFATLGDSGINASAARFSASNELLRVRGYLVKSSDGVEERLWPLFDKLPHPVVLANNYDRISPVSSINVRPDGDGEQTIFVSPSQIDDD